MTHIHAETKRIISRRANVLDLREVKTPRQIQIEEYRNRITLASRKRVSKVKDFTLAQNVSAETDTSDQYQKSWTMGLSSMKIVSLLLMVVLNLTAVFVVGPTVSYYSDPEESNENAFTTGLVDFVLEAIPFSTIATTTASSSEVWNVDVLPHELSNPFYYYASSTNFHGNVDLCKAINVIATLDGEVMYEGLLTDMTTGTTTNIAEWEFTFTDFIGDFPGQTCHFDVDFNGWQTRHGIAQGGYSDTESVPFWITDPSMVFAKVFFGNAASAATSSRSWIELYNPTPEAIDMSGWRICDNALCSVVPSVPVVEPGGFALVISDVSVLDDMIVPIDVVIVTLDTIGDGLLPAGDMLQLITDEDYVADQINWGVSDENWPNYNDDVWTPGVPATESGSALARIPLDNDMDVPEDFVALLKPGGSIQEPDAQSEWEEGEDETIRWTATNPNGDDDALRIDLYYVDATGTTHIIVLDTENDGEHEWEVIGEPGDDRHIKMVVTSPENILLQEVATAGIGCIEGGGQVCNGLILEFTKKFSGVDLGYTPDQFSFHVVGGEIDTLVPHDQSVLLPVGAYTITEIGPEGFSIPDWRIQWSGDTCTGENIAGGQGYIEVEERDLRKVVSYCWADNQYRPDSRDRFIHPDHVQITDVLGAATSTILSEATSTEVSSELSAGFFELEIEVEDDAELEENEATSTVDMLLEADSEVVEEESEETESEEVQDEAGADAVEPEVEEVHNAEEPEEVETEEEEVESKEEETIDDPGTDI